MTGLLLSFVSAIISVKSEIMQFNNKPLVDQLQKSLTQVNDMLADIEVKIDSERKQLSKTDYDLHQKDTATGFMDYQVSDIWWSTKKPPPPVKPNPPVVRSPHEPKNGLRYKLTPAPVTQEIAISDIVARWAHNTKNLPAFRVSTFKQTSATTPPTTTLSKDVTTTTPRFIITERAPKALFSKDFPRSVYLNWPFVNTPHPGNTEFVAELINTMNKRKYGYFTVGLTKFLEMLTTRDPNNTTPLLSSMEEVADRVLSGHKSSNFYKNIRKDVTILMNSMNSKSIHELRNMSKSALPIMDEINHLASWEINECLGKLDAMFLQIEGIALFGALEEFHMYPDGGQSASEVSKDMLRAALAPFFRLHGTEEQNLLLSCLNEGKLIFYHPLRDEKDSESNKKGSSPSKRQATYGIGALTNGRPSNYTGEKRRAVTVPSRRHISHKYQKRIRQFLRKHREMFKALKTHHKHGKRNEHHLHHNDRYRSHHKKPKDQNEKLQPDDQYDEQDLLNPRDSLRAQGRQDEHNLRGGLDKHDSRDEQDLYDQQDKLGLRERQDKRDELDLYNQPYKHRFHVRHDNRYEQDLYDQQDKHGLPDHQDKRDEQDLYDQQYKQGLPDRQDKNILRGEQDVYDQRNDQNLQDAYNQYGQYDQYDQQQKFLKITNNPSQVRSQIRTNGNNGNASDSEENYQEVQKKHWPIHKTKAIAIDPVKTAPTPNIFETIGKHFLLGLAKKFEAEIQNENNRKFKVALMSGSDKESKRTSKNKLIHKMRESSSYSDEEINLKTNLYGS